MTLKECYEAMGGDYGEVIGRLRSDKLVAKFALKFLDDKSYESLKENLAAENYGEAFRAAHTLKGVCQNLGFKNLYEPAHELTEQLRDGAKPSDLSWMELVDQNYEKTIAAIRRYQADNA